MKELNPLPYVGVHRFELQAGPDGCVSIRPFGLRESGESPLTPFFLVLTPEIAQELAIDLNDCLEQSQENYRNRGRT